MSYHQLIVGCFNLLCSNFFLFLFLIVILVLKVWPYLLGHYEFGSLPKDRQQVDYTTRQNYETTMSEWLAVEAIVRQRDKELMAANLVKLSSESTSGEAPPPGLIMQDMANDVSFTAVIFN